MHAYLAGPDDVTTENKFKLLKALSWNCSTEQCLETEKEKKKRNNNNNSQEDKTTGAMTTDHCCCILQYI